MGYKIKRILVGTQQVRPERNYEYSINFKDYSNISQVQALGWSFIGQSSTYVPGVNQTYGFYNSTYQNDVWWVKGEYPISVNLSNANKIVITMTGYGPSSSNNAGYECCGLSKNMSGINIAGLYGYFQFRGNTNDALSLNNDSAVNIWSQNIGSATAYSGQYTLTLEIDFVNKLATYTSTGKSKTGTHSLSDSDIAYIKTLTHLHIHLNAYNHSAINNQIWSASIKVK